MAKDNWTYETSFQVPDELLKKKIVNLVFHGLDTIAEIRLNGKIIKNADNMFLAYVLPVKDEIITSNVLQVKFASPILASALLAQEHKKNYTVPPECTPDQYNGECHVNFLRKMQASFAWDWGPAFPSVGIW